MTQRGRPLLPPPANSKQRIQISCIVTARMKTRLMHAAADNQRTLASEVAARLEESFSRRERIAELQNALRAVLREHRSP